jgi:CheY-like chemotaxis protein
MATGLRAAMQLEIPSLLITDDDADLRETLREALERRGYRTLAAGDGEQALEILQNEQVHLLLLDMYMPRLTGLDTVRRVKLAFADLPCILMTANLDERLAEEAQRARVFRVFSKPVPFADLTGSVQQALQQTYGWSDRRLHT